MYLSTVLNYKLLKYHPSMPRTIHSKIIIIIIIYYTMNNIPTARFSNATLYAISLSIPKITVVKFDFWTSNLQWKEKKRVGKIRCKRLRHMCMSAKRLAAEILT